MKNFRFVNYGLGVLILLAVLLSARNVIQMSYSKKGDVIPVSQETTLMPMNKKDIMEYSPILEQNPFGRPLKLIPLAAEEEKEAPPASLSNLKLLGTVTGPEEYSYAVFEDSSSSPPGGQEVFALGDIVFNYGILRKVSTASVEIARDSVIHRLNIPLEDMSEDRGADGASLDTGQDNTFVRQVGEQEYVLDSRQVQQSLENPEHILTDARLLPNFVNGKQEGFRISEVIPDGLYHNLGIRNGDILLKVNGLEISNPEVAMQAMTALRGMNRVSLDLIRDGKNMSMDYQIR